MNNRPKLISKDDSIFLAGHRGMAGKSIYKALKNNGYENIIFVNRKELDLTIEADVSEWFKQKKTKSSNSCCC